MSKAHETPSSLPTLYHEHLRLGAHFGEGGVPLWYERTSPCEGSEVTFVCDLTHACVLLFSGEPSQAFAQAAFAGSKLQVGGCAFEAVLTGDGSVASIPLLARTGADEYVAVDASPRAEILATWLSFLSSVSQEGFSPYEGMLTDDVTRSHVLLLLGGRQATKVLGDYVGSEALPGRGEVSSIHLDAIPCIVLGLPLIESTVCYAIFVPPARAAALWQSFLSFTQVTPLGMQDVTRVLGEGAKVLASLNTHDSLRLPASTLRKSGVMRQEQDFVGARGLAGN